MKHKFDFSDHIYTEVA